jgi:hypothetical protein
MSGMETVCGYAVVRLPSHNYDEAGRGGFNLSPPRLGHVYYEGVMRMAWFDVDEAYYAGTLPAELRILREAAKEPFNFTGLDLVADIQHARELLAFSNRDHKQNEIMAVFSEVLTSIYGTFTLAANELEWLGWDAALLGSYSLLEDGLFWKPQLFEEHRQALNLRGLFPSAEVARGYVAAYRPLADKGVLDEPLVEEPYPVDAVRVGHLRDERSRSRPVGSGWRG